MPSTIAVKANAQFKYLSKESIVQLGSKIVEPEYAPIANLVKSGRYCENKIEKLMSLLTTLNEIVNDSGKPINCKLIKTLHAPNDVNFMTGKACLSEKNAEKLQAVASKIRHNDIVLWSALTGPSISSEELLYVGNISYFNHNHYGMVTRYSTVLNCGSNDPQKAGSHHVCFYFHTRNK